MGLQLRKTAPRQEDLGAAMQRVACQNTGPSMKNEQSRRRVPVRLPEARFQRAEREKVVKEKRNQQKQGSPRQEWLAVWDPTKESVQIKPIIDSLSSGLYVIDDNFFWAVSAREAFGTWRKN